jgi:hypothetical protein
MPQSPQVADTAPDEPFLTGYDIAHLVTYLRLLDADAEGADWQEVATIVLELDVAKDPKRARRSWASHLAGQMDDRERLSLSPARRPAELSTKSATAPGHYGVEIEAQGCGHGASPAHACTEATRRSVCTL